MPQENVIQLLPQAPEPLTAEEIEFATSELLSFAGDTRPIESLSQRADVWAAFVRMAETDPGLLNRTELRMRVAMKEANAPDVDAQKFNFKPIRDEAKQNQRERDKKNQEHRRPAPAQRQVDAEWHGGHRAFGCG